MTSQLQVHVGILLGMRYLHGHEPIVDKDFLGKEIGSDGCLVASAEFLVDLSSGDDVSVSWR